MSPNCVSLNDISSCYLAGSLKFSAKMETLEKTMSKHGQGNNSQ